MMTVYIGDDGDLKATQRDVSPTVYLDHWALRTFSEDGQLTARLVSALRSREGTLALSWLNLAEFAKVTNEEQTRKAESLIDATLPRLFFLEVDPFVVIDREDKLLAGGPPAPPHADQEFLKVFVTLKPPSPTLLVLTADGLFQGMRDQGLLERKDGLTNTFVGRIEALRTECETDPSFQSAVRRSASGPRIQRGTRLILRELVRALIVDRQTTITANHAMDFFHAVVPVAYCELVLLDKYWEEQVTRVSSRFAQAGMTVPIARIFSKTANGVERFIRELESG